MDVRKIKKRVEWLRRTPLHPQWFVSGDQDQRLRHLHRLSGDVLDIGCSDKALARHLPKDCRYVGLDYYATVHTIYGTHPDVYGDACRLPLRNGCMDAVMLFEVLEHVPDPRDALAEISRVLRPGGMLLLSVPFMYPIHNAPFDFHRFTRYALRHSLQQHGFEIESISPRLHSMEVGGLTTSLALGDAARQVLERHRWALPAVIPIALLVLLSNISAWLLARVLPGSDFMPGGYEAVAVRTA